MSAVTGLFMCIRNTKFERKNVNMFSIYFIFTSKNEKLISNVQANKYINDYIYTINRFYSLIFIYYISSPFKSYVLRSFD